MGFFPKDLHTVNINGLDLSFNRKDNINHITKDKNHTTIISSSSKL